MKNLLMLKENIKTFYSKYQVYITPAAKFLLALVTLLLINNQIGYMGILKNFAIVLIVALMCSFLPINFTIFFAALFTLLHFYAIGMECAIVGLILFTLIFIFYFRFTPKDALVVILLPICFIFKIPYLIPITMGLIGTPISIVSVACGTIFYYVIIHVRDNVTVFSSMEESSMGERFRLIIDGIIHNKAMIATIIVFSIVVILVYSIRRMSMDHAWTVAIISGAVVGGVVMLIAILVLDLPISIIGVILGSIVSVFLAKVAEFLLFNVDYSRVEKVQFEDDEYYYFVKAVPKTSVTTPQKRVHKINGVKVK